MSDTLVTTSPAEIPTPTIAELEADPHGVFRRYRATMSVIGHEGLGFLVLRAGDIDRLIRDPRVRQIETEFALARGITGGTLLEFFTEGMLTSNGAVHRRRRSPFSRSFAARVIAELRPVLRRNAEELIDRWRPGEEIDFIEGFAGLLPAQAIAGLLGLPPQDIPRFTQLVYGATRALSLSYAPEDLPDIEADMRSLKAYVEGLLAERRAAPQNDFLSAYLCDADQKGEMSALEIVIQVMQMIIGGTDTTRGAMAAQVSLLLQRRHQWDMVCRDLALVPAAVTEALRYEPSVASVGRFLQEDVELDGLTLPAGQMVTLALISGLRDERVYHMPDVFDIRRTEQPRLHPVFGGGPHRCIGEALARAELEEGLAALATRVPELEPVGEPFRLLGHFGIRRVSPMRVRRAR
ncbi:cytochrome P450 [Bradyrhizobium sp. STM 3562]|uniref:cytochrome P450 n=1 Tax=Bradyrhizobium sp. STM 3562 TaxID=578924 RepID=UPI00388FC844